MPSPARCWAASTVRWARCWAASRSGVIENLGGAYLVGTELKLTMALVIIVAVLTIKPTGLMGRRGRTAGYDASMRTPWIIAVLVLLAAIVPVCRCFSRLPPVPAYDGAWSMPSPFWAWRC